jgi:hypothetical protein
MYMREQLVGSILAVAMSTCALLAIPSQSLMSEAAVQSSLDAEFAAAISRIASLPRVPVNAPTATDVAYLFKEMTDMYRLSDIRDFVAAHYPMTRIRDVVAGNLEYADVNDKALKELNPRFLLYDRLDLGFKYSEDWKDVIEFKAVLRNLRDF